jgi:dipeptidyl aminopeptidase/acylaminoacyl peptidase
LPWEHPETWEALSPFNKVTNVKTPTLIMCGEKDWNVPVQNSDQLYIALKRLGVETSLVVYPDQHHWVSLPSMEADIYARWLDWFERHTS